MIIGISGTPGTGKSTIGQMVASKIRYGIIDINHEIMDREIYDEYDSARDSVVVDTEKLNEFLKKKLRGRKNVILDGHLSHFLNFLDFLIILRTNPCELKIRLDQRNWSRTKVVENIHAEILDVILQESLELQRNICEIDTTKKKFSEVSEVICELIKNPLLREKYRPGKVNWTGYMSCV